LSGGRGIPGPIGTVVVASTAAYDNRHESPDRILFEVVAYVAVDAAVDTYATIYALAVAAPVTITFENPPLGTLLGAITFMQIQIQMDQHYGDVIDQKIDTAYES